MGRIGERSSIATVDTKPVLLGDNAAT